MKEVKFTCNSCGQHIVCDTQFSGRTTDCPTCGKAVRIPAVVAKTSTTRLKAAEPKTQRIATTRSATKGGRKEDLSATSPVLPRSNKQPANQPSARQKERVSSAAGKQQASVEMPVARQGLCPVCQSLLETTVQAVDTTKKPGSQSKRLFRLVRRGEVPADSGVATVSDSAPSLKKPKRSDKATKGQQSFSAEENAARARSSGTTKPRMDYILTGKPPKPAKKQ